MKTFFDSVLLMLVLFNPLLMSAFLHGVMSKLSFRVFFAVVGRAFVVSGVVFCLFAWFGDGFFSNVLQVRFAAFLIFGGIVFLMIALRYVVHGAEMVGQLRGDVEHLSGSIAMPFMIGPGTISASVLTGTKLPVFAAWGAITIALAISCILLMIVKALFDKVQKQNERVLERYVEAAGRASALVIGTIAVEMIVKGIDLWWAELPKAAAR